MKWKWMLSVAVLSALWGTTAYPQAPPDSNQYVSRQEYDKLKGEIDALKAEMAAIRKERTAPTADVNQAREVQSLKAEVATLKQERMDANQVREVQALKTEMTALKQEHAAQIAEANETLGELNAQVAAVKKEADRTRLGDTKLLISGFTHASYTDRRTENSTFDAGLNTNFLWELNDRLLFEGQLEFSLQDDNQGQSSSTDTSLEFADMTYIINDYMLVGAGKFLVPFGIFNERLHQDWINKLPDRPLIYSDEQGIVQESGVGAFIRGAVPSGSTQWNYALYIDNGPSLITDDPDNYGNLDLDNDTDTNHNKTVGGRLGFLPVPALEVGYSVQVGEINPSNFENVNMLTQGFDITYKRQVESLRGDIDLRTEWVWTDISNATYDPTGANGGPFRFDNDRSGYYMQAAYRPTLAEEKVLRNFEFVLRYDSLTVPSDAPGSADEHRWTPGIDYWITPSTVVKVAYQFDETSGSQDRNALLLQAAMGF